MRRSLLLLSLALGVLALCRPRSSSHDVDAGTAVRLDVSQLAERADLVLEARVLSASAALGAGNLVETEVVLDVERTLYGVHEPTRSVHLPGGLLPNGNGLLLPGMPSLQPGEDVLLFLSEASDSGVRMPVGLSQGKFRVETNLSGARRLRRSHGSLTTVPAGGGALWDSTGDEVFDYAATLAEVHAALSLRPPVSAPEGDE